LLVYLLLHQEQPHTHEHLADVLWGEIPTEQSKSYLRKALWQLQSSLDAIQGKDLLVVDAEWIQFNPRSDCWLDIAILEKTFKTVQGIRGKDLVDRQVQTIQEAVEIYQSGLLVGWYQDWCLYEREHLQFLYLALLDKLMDYCEAYAEYEKGILFAERILQHDRAHERTHRCLMRLHYLAGDRTSALRQYQKCVAILREELDVEPAESTRQLFEMIRKDKLEGYHLPLEKTISRLENEPLRVVLSHLSTFSKELSQIQNKLAQDMQMIQRSMKGNRH
jgi:DNA-binding SARP family transcriptional activator